MIELAVHHGSGKPMQIGVIAQRHGIPPRFLVQILLQLKGAGFVASTRGASGGYQLTKDPGAIAVADVVKVIEGHPKGGTVAAGNRTPIARVLASVWDEVKAAERAVLESTSIAQLVDRVRGETERMYYI
jgi:Rrf2 family protein